MYYLNSPEVEVFFPGWLTFWEKYPCDITSANQSGSDEMLSSGSLATEEEVTFCGTEGELQCAI